MSNDHVTPLEGMPQDSDHGAQANPACKKAERNLLISEALASVSRLLNVVADSNTLPKNVPEVLAVVDTLSQPAEAGGALMFSQNSITSGDCIVHEAGASAISITQPGIYRASLQAAASIDSETPVPSTLAVVFTLNDADLPGAKAIHAFTSSHEVAPLLIDTVFAVVDAPAKIQIVVNEAGFTFENIALTITRLGDKA